MAAPFGHGLVLGKFYPPHLGHLQSCPAATGVAAFAGHLEQLRTYSGPGRDPRMRVVSVAHVARSRDHLAPAVPAAGR